MTINPPGQNQGIKNANIMENETPTNEEVKVETPESTPEEEQVKSPEEATSQTNPEDLQKQIKELQAQKEHWRNKYQKVADATQDETPKKPEEITAKTEGSDLTAVEVLRLKDKGFSDNEILSLEAYAAKTNRNIGSLVDDELIMAGIEKQREAKRSEQATPPPSSAPTIKVGEKTFAEMSKSERTSNWGKIVEGKTGGKI